MICGRRDDTLIGHHIESIGSGGADDLSNMITLCGTCHDHVERGYIDYGRADVQCKKFMEKPYGLGASARPGATMKGYQANEILRRVLDEAYG